MLKKLKSRLKGQQGESIAEVLIAVLVSAVGLTLLALMISTTARTVTYSKTTIKTYVSESNRLAEKGEGATVGGTVSVKSDFGHGDEVVMLTDSSPGEIAVVYYVNSSLSNVSVTSYKRETAP